MGNKQKKRDNTGKKTKEIKLKPVKIKFDKKEIKEKADESDLEESLENENVFHLDNPNNANNADTTNNVYRAVESNTNQSNNPSRMDSGELNSSDIFRAHRSRERTNPNQETSLRDNYSSADKNYQ